MKTRRYWLILALIVFTLLVLAAASRQWVTTQELPAGVKLTMASDYRLDGTVADNLVVVAGSIVLEMESRVIGDASLIADTIQLDGRVEGNLTTLGDHLTLAPGSHISGDAALVASDITLGGRVDGDVQITSDRLTIMPDAQIAGIITPCAATIRDNRIDAPALTACSDRQRFPPFDALIALRNQMNTLEAAQLAAPGSALLTLVLGSLVLAGFSTLAVAMFPRQISRIEEAIRLRPRGLGGVGIAVFLLVFGISAALIVVLAILPPVGLLLLPIYALVGLALAALIIAGLVTLSLVIGDWVVRRISPVPAPPLVTASIGSLILSALLTVMALAPFGVVIGLVALLALSSVGVGAALFTRLGTRPLQRSYFVQG
jgi:hypothetical protein